MIENILGLESRVPIMRWSSIECFYYRPPPNRRLYEPKNDKYTPLQAANLKNEMRDRLVFTMLST